MLNKFKNNKFEQAISELTNLCKECNNSNNIDCPCNRECEIYDLKFNDLYYDMAYPLDPCKDCIFLSMCRETSQCEEFNHHYNMRDVAKSDLLGHQICFSKNKIRLLHGHSESITKEDFKQKRINGENVDIELTKEYIKKIKNDSRYEEILEIEKQRLEYFHGYKFVKDENDRWIINPNNTTNHKQIKKQQPPKTSFVI